MMVLVLLAACSPQAANKKITSGPETTGSHITPETSNLSLADYLKRIPGVQVTQNTVGTGNVQVTVRGANSMGDNREPLFIVNGVNIGNGYERAAPLVDVNDIASVQVLKSGQETAPYGMQGSNGVIVIKTKRQ